IMNENFEEPYPTVMATVRGKGTRLYPLTLEKSKSLISVANRPILERIFETMASYACRSFWIIGEYELYNYFRNGEEFSGKLGLSPHAVFNYTTEEDRGNADGVKIALEKRHRRIKKHKITGDVIIVSGDCVINIDLKRLMERHRESGADMTVVLKEVEDVSSYGVAQLEGEKIVDFIEKPKPDKAPSNLINTFIYVVSTDTLREVFNEMESKNVHATDFGSHIIPYMTKTRLVRPYVNEGYWEDLGVPKTLLQANLAMLQGKIGGITLDSQIHPTSELSIGRNVNLNHVLIGANVSIGDNCKLMNVCIESNAIIEDDVSIEDSVIYFNARIGRGCKVIKSIIDVFAYTGKETQVGDSKPDEVTVIGAHTKLGDGWRIWPGELIIRYSPEARKQIVNAKRYDTNLYKIVSDDGENLYFVDRMILKKTYSDMPPPIFKTIT
ncbi:MAG: NDP-sugar synthase, partial [Candidatus Bathyarchaeota archaeon]